MRNGVLSIPAIQRGAFPNPHQVAPVLGSRYLALRVFLDDRCLSSYSSCACISKSFISERISEIVLDRMLLIDLSKSFFLSSSSL